MTFRFLDLKASELLARFGAGAHTPGSGSAAALQGLIAANLLKTVISLTSNSVKKGNRSYSHSIEELLEIKRKLEGEIMPNLTELFQADSNAFDEVIDRRRKRDRAEMLVEKQSLAKQATKALIPATEIPLKIAYDCVSLCKFSFRVFDDGFQPARGDAGVAIQAAISAGFGCISIIELNLLSVEPSIRAREVVREKNRLLESLKSLQKGAIRRLEGQKRLSVRQEKLHDDFSDIARIARDERKLKEADIEKIAIRLQRAIWLNRDLIWKRSVPTNPLGVLQPDSVLQSYGFLVDRSDPLDGYKVQGASADVAGIIDQENSIVSISPQFSPEVMKFTSAHELGHYLLHSQSGVHRDIAVDGSDIRVRKDWKEWQADKFATFFLMPQKMVRRHFEDSFRTEKFVITDETAFALTSKSTDYLYEMCRNAHDLALILAQASRYAGDFFDPLSRRFGVSHKAMAIRLLELELLSFE